MITVPNQLVASSADAAGPHAGQQDAQPGLVARTIYRTSYCLSFGIVLPTLLVARALPTHNAMGYGLRDGARAANDAQQRFQARTAAATSAALNKVGDAYAGVAARVSSRVEAIEDAIAERRYRRRIATA